VWVGGGVGGGCLVGGGRGGGVCWVVGGGGGGKNGGGSGRSVGALLVRRGMNVEGECKEGGYPQRQSQQTPEGWQSDRGKLNNLRGLFSGRRIISERGEGERQPVSMRTRDD